MAQGTNLAWNALTEYLGDGTLDMDGDTFKCKLSSVGVGTTPFIQTKALPKSADATEASPATGNYTAGGETLTTVAWTLAGAVTTFNADDVVINSHASNPTDVKTAMIFSETATQTVDAAVCYIDLTTDGGTTAIDLTTTNLTIQFGGSGIFTVTRS